MATVFSYEYRDSHNYRSVGHILLDGQLSDSDIAEIVGSMESEEFFVAEQVGLPPLYLTSPDSLPVRSAADHTWHFFRGFEKVKMSENSDNVFWGSAHELKKAFVKIENWDISLSRNF